jgi:hypothetical protein
MQVGTYQDKFYDIDQAAFLGPRLLRGNADFSTLIPSSSDTSSIQESTVTAAERDLRACEGIMRATEAIMNRLQTRDLDERGGVTRAVGFFGIFGALALIGAISMPHAGLDKDLSFHDMKAGITWERAIDKHCWLQFGTDISGGVDFSLRPNVTVHGHNVFNVPGLSQVTDAVKPVWSESMKNNKFTGTVCNDSADMYVEPNEKDGKVHIGFIGKNPFDVTVQPDNFLAVEWTSTPNPTAALVNMEGSQIKFVGSFVPPQLKTLPGVKEIYGQSVEDDLKALLETAGLGLTQSACAETAVEDSKEAMEKMMINNVAGQGEQYANDHHLNYNLPLSTYVVDWPTGPVVKDSTYLDQLTDYSKSKDMHLTGDSLNSVNCTGLTHPAQKPLTAK